MKRNRKGEVTIDNGFKSIAPHADREHFAKDTLNARCNPKHVTRQQEIRDREKRTEPPELTNGGSEEITCLEYDLAGQLKYTGARQLAGKSLDAGYRPDIISRTNRGS